MKKIGLFLFTVFIVAGMAGCGSNYYSVKDPLGGGIYFTKEVEVVRGGAVKFTDGRSGAIVTIQNSAVKEITEQEFNVGVYTPEPAKPVSAPAPLQIQVVPPAPASVPSPTAAPEISPAPIEAPAQAK
jgi:hypothetical protein